MVGIYLDLYIKGVFGLYRVKVRLQQKGVVFPGPVSTSCCHRFLPSRPEMKPLRKSIRPLAASQPHTRYKLHRFTRLGFSTRAGSQRTGEFNYLRSSAFPSGVSARRNIPTRCGGFHSLKLWKNISSSLFFSFFLLCFSEEMICAESPAGEPGSAWLLGILTFLFSFFFNGSASCRSWQCG